MRNSSPPCWKSVHPHVTERIVAFLGVPQRACARRASKALWKAVRAASMEDLLRATVLDQRDPSAPDAQLVVAAMSRAVGSFPSADALVAWSGGLALLHEELPQRFPRATAMAVSARFVDLTHLSSLRIIDASTFSERESLQSIRLVNLPLLESIAARAFSGCVNLMIVDLADLPALRVIGNALPSHRVIGGRRAHQMQVPSIHPSREIAACREHPGLCLL